MNAFLHSLIGTAAMAVALIAPAAAQWKPTKPVHLVVPLAPGSNLDNQARLLAKGMSDALGVPVVVDNKPGGGTLIAARQVMTASPDGYTLLYNVAVMTTMPHLYKKAPFDLFKDFTPITAGSLGSRKTPSCAS